MSTLSPYSGPWGFDQAAHLLRRTTFGPSYERIKAAENAGRLASVNFLIADQPMPDPPIHFRYPDDPEASIGQSWVNTQEPQPQVSGLNGARKRSLKAWMMGLMADGTENIMAKMFLFWHEHLPVNGLRNGQIGYLYTSKLLEHSLGNVKQLIEDITIDPAMLLFLNGNENIVDSPNENFARELLELFTIGRGLEAGPGDYTNYTEEDVREIARALTGWTITTDDDTVFAPRFRSNRHDQEDKQLSPRFENQTITNLGEEEYKTVVDIIFQKQEVARYICRQLHIWFISPNISTDTEQNIIEPLSQIMVDNNYEIKPVLDTLFNSEYFFDDSHIGCYIMNPVDFAFKVTNTFEFSGFDNKVQEYKYFDIMHSLATIQDMSLLEIPSVAGWKAYYQGPAYNKVWINSISLSLRERFTDIFVVGIMVEGNNYALDFLDFVSKFEDIYDPNVLIEECARVLFAYPLSDNQHDFLKNLLIPGLPDASWTMEYSEYLADPTDPDRIEGITNRLKALFVTMLKMPEFYLS